MKKILSIFLVFTLLLPQIVFAQTMPNDQYTLGQGSSSSDKGFIFNTGDGASNKKLLIEDVSKLLKFDGNSFQLGDGADTDKEFKFNGSSKSLKYNATTDEFEFNDDLKLTGSETLKVDSIDSGSGTETAVEQDLRVKQKVRVGTGDNYIGVAGGNLVFSNAVGLEKKLGSGSGSGAGGINLLTNDSVEDGVGTGFSNSGGTLTQGTHTNGMEGDTKYANFVSSVIGDYLETTAVAVPDSLGKGCQATVKVKITSGSWTMRVIDGSSADLIDTYTITDPGPTTGEWFEIPVKSLRCPSAGSTFKIRLTSTAIGTIAADKFYLGGNRNMVAVSGAGYVGKIDFSTSDCSFTTTSASITNVSDASCTKTVSGRVQARGDNVLGFSGTFPKGLCTVSAYGVFAGSTAASSGDATIDLRINDETNSVAGTTTRSGFTSGATASVSTRSDQQTFKFSSTGSAQTLAIQMAAINAESALFNGGSMYISCESDVTQEAYTTSESEWFIDANIGGANSSAPSVSSSPLPWQSTGWDLVLNTKSAPAKIPCSGGNAPTGLTCSAGNELLGIVFTNPRPGLYEVCGSMTMNANGSLSSTEWMELASTTSTTIVQLGKTRVQSYMSAGTNYHPLTNCGTFYFSDVKERAIVLHYETPGTVTSIFASRTAVYGQEDIHIVARPLLSAHDRPYTTGDQVTSPNQDRPIQFTLEVSATGVITDNDAGIVTSCNSSSPMTCTLNSGAYSELKCNAEKLGVIYSSGWLYNCNVEIQPTSGGSMQIGCGRASDTTAAAYSAQGFTLFCMGKK